MPSSVRIKLTQVADINLGFSNKVNPFEGFNWSVFDLVFDLGNASGLHIADILSISEQMNICIYDNSEAIQSSKIFWRNENANSIKNNAITFRVSFEEGEILSSLPTASSHENLYCFVNVFSELNDSDCLSILKNAKQAIGLFTATLAIIDFIRSESIINPHEAIKDKQLLLDKDTKQRTLTQWKTLVNKSDFTLSEVVELRSSNKVLVLKLI